MTLLRVFLLICCFIFSVNVLQAENYQLIIKKADRTLELQRDGKSLKTYKIALGFSPLGSKQQQGDGKTPEGSYYICGKNPGSKFYLSLAISYPNEIDAKRGLQNGLINQSQYRLIVSAQQRKGVPPWNTALGGEIFIHGEGTARDWTFGCVALENPDIKELYDLIPAGTPITILP
jgi:murein L,D-transpeptidase YafK